MLTWYIPHNTIKNYGIILKGTIIYNKFQYLKFQICYWLTNRDYMNYYVYDKGWK